MKRALRFTILMFLSCVLISCASMWRPYVRGIDFVKKYDTNVKNSLFADNENIYVVNLMPESVFFIDKNEGILKKENPDHKELIDDMCSDYNIISTDNMALENFIANGFNENFTLGLREGSYDSYYDKQSMRGGWLNPKLANLQTNKLNVFSINLTELTYSELVYKTQITNEGKKVKVLEPKDLDQFCEEFKKVHSECDYLILMSNFYFSNVPITYSIYYSSHNTAGPTFLISKTIIDINDKKIVAYDLNQTFVALPKRNKLDLKQAIKDRFKLEGLRLNYFL